MEFLFTTQMIALSTLEPHFKTDNLLEENLFIERMVELVDKEKPNAIVLMGDILHTHDRLQAAALNKACEFIDLMRKRAHTFILVGNHDFYNNNQFCNEKHWMNPLKYWKNVTVVDKAIFHSIVQGDNTVNIFLVPFVPPGRLEEALKTTELDYTDADSVHCIFAHQEFEGVVHGVAPSTVGDPWPENYPLVISGHIHNKHWLRKNIYYCGSSMQHAFGEFGDNTIPIITFEKDSTKAEIIEHDLELPRKRTIRTDLQGIEEMKIDETKRNDKVRLTVTCSVEEFKSLKKSKKFKELSKSGAKIVCKPEKVQIAEGDLIKKVSEITQDKSDFLTILQGLIDEEEDSGLQKLYNEIVLEK
jgi:DNA repair exonuclease SbcCD nuclease subunit